MNTTVESCQHINESNITYNIGGRPVYREQCLKCYDDPQSERGLDVCLKCYSGNCRNEMFDHSNLHYMQKNHPIVLNITEIEINEKDSDKEKNEFQKITKLAIGRPGGMELVSDEQWERHLSVKCLICKVEIDCDKNPRLKDLVTSILNTSSGERKADIVAWELDVNPCEHTLTLQQDQGVQVASKLKATCNDCNLSSALWLCLTCGNLACGRKNFDGTGGNAHAMAHYQKTKHPLVVKTGTITPQGEASLYCYTCDEEVKDPELSLRLKNLGIDVSSQVKTEKTMTELNLEMNLNFTLSKAYEEGKLLQPVYGPGFTGLENLGNSCYMNSVLQILFSLEHFQKFYLDNALEHLSTCHLDPLECFQCQISKIMYGLYSGVYSMKRVRNIPKTEESHETTEEYQKGIKPFSFKMLIGKDHPEFSSTRQQDAFEYLAFILDKFERFEKSCKRPSSKNIFEFDLETRLECSQCHCVKYKTQKNLFLTLNVPNWESKKDDTSICLFDEVILKFLGEENVDLKCSECKNSTTWTKTQRVKSFPNYLVIIFQRFVYDWVPIKLETKLQIPHDFDIKILTTPHSKVGEKVVVENEESFFEELEPEVNKEALSLLIQNGVPELAAKHALIKNENNPDLAIYWYFDNMDNPILNTQIPKIKKNKVGLANQNQNANKPAVPQESVEMVCSIIGCSNVTAEGALRKCDNNPDRALDYILSHPEENFEEPEQNQVGAQISDQVHYEVIKSDSSLYDLYAFITHLGKNTSHGHYVCHIKKGENWIYYNDNKVTISYDPPVQKAYIYVFRNKHN